MQLDVRIALSRALALAEALGDLNYQIRVLYGLWLFALRVVDFHETLLVAHKCELLAETTGDPTANATANLTFGISRYYLGEHAAAATNLRRARDVYPMAMRGGDSIRFGVDLSSNSRCYQSVTLWSLGFADMAYHARRDALAEARTVNHPVSLCIALAAPSSIFLVKMGYLDEAERCIEELLEHSQQHSLTPYHAFGLCSKGGLAAARGDLAEAERLLRFGLRRSREVAYKLFEAFFRGELAAVLASSGRIDEGLFEIDAALRYAEETASLWCAGTLAHQGRVARQTRRCRHGGGFVRSIDLAHRQEALSWELRSAISLARLWHDRGRTVEARELLDGVYRRFVEGFDTADSQAAKRLLHQLS